MIFLACASLFKEGLGIYLTWNYSGTSIQRRPKELANFFRHVGTGNKNRDDFHCMQMRLVMRKWIMFRDDWGDARSWSRSSMAFWPWCNFPRSTLDFRVFRTRVVGRENIIAEEILFRTVCIEALHESQNIFRAFFLWIVFKLLKKMV